MNDGKGPVAVALLGLVGVCVASFVLGSPAGSRRGPAAAQAFLDAWRANRMATYVAEYRFTRRFPDGNTLEQRTVTMQRPPGDRIISGLGSVDGRLGGKIVRCASDPAGTSRCFTSTDAPPYDQEVEDEIGGLRAYVLAARPLYDVIEFAEVPGDCFRLDLALQVPSPPYGNHALFCFDSGTHVTTRTVIERTEATDTEVATSVRTSVTSDDLRIPTDIGQVIGQSGPTTTTTSTTVTVPSASVPTTTGSGG